MRMIFLLTLLKLCLGAAVPCHPNDVYSVTLPGEIEALAGSCVLIPCMFNVSKSCEAQLKQPVLISAMWLKGEPKTINMVFNSTQNTTKEFDRIEVLGNLYQRNCTTIFYNIQSNHRNKYYFRTESSVFKYTFWKTHFQLTVKDSPASPQVSGPSEVAEGSSVNLTCTAAAPCPHQPPNITWSLHTGNITTHIQDKEEGRRSLTSFLTFNAYRSHHGRAIFCTVSYITQNIAKNSSVEHLLRVQFSPEVVGASVSPSGVVTKGSSVTLTCNSSEANPPVHNYTWFRDTQTSPVGSGPNITFNVNSSYAGLYYCRAEHPQGAKESSRVRVKLHTDSLPEDPSSSLIYLMSAGGCLGVLLLCVVTGFALRVKKSKVTEQNKQNSTHQGSAVHAKDGPANTKAPNPTRDQQEEIHYGEISFSTPPLRDPSEGTGQQAPALESEYSEVLLSGRDGKARYQKASDIEDLYAQVKRK